MEDEAIKAVARAVLARWFPRLRDFVEDLICVAGLFVLLFVMLSQGGAF